MAYLSTIFLVVFGYYVCTVLVTAKFKCNKATNTTSIAIDQKCSSVSDLTYPSSDAAAAAICCKWIGQQLSVECCPQNSNYVTQCAGASYSESNCICRPIPAKNAPLCNKQFFYNMTKPASTLPDVFKCCNEKNPKQSECCQVDDQTGYPYCQPTYSTAACKT